MINEKTTRMSSVAVGIFSVGVLLLMAGVASARVEILRWTHPAPSNIIRFEALVGTRSQSYGPAISLGKPAADAQGVFSASISVADNADVYIAIQAVDNNGLTSFPSNERLRSANLGAPPPASTPPPPTPAGLNSGIEIPANPNATLRVDFNSGTATNWLDTAANNSLAVNDNLFSVTAVGGNPALTTQNAETNIHSHFVGSPNNFGDLTLTGRMATGNPAGGVGVTAYSQYPVSDTYYRLRSQRSGETFTLGGHPLACTGNVDTGVVAEANVWYEFEMTVSNQSGANRITASIWKQGDPKPGSPQADCIDTAASRPSAGTIGVWSMGSGAKYWDDLEVTAASGGGPIAPTGPPAAPILIDIKPIN